jgi:hypothetical protein
MKLDAGFAFVLGLLAIPVVTHLSSLTPSGREDTTHSQLSDLDVALHRYRDHRGRFPPPEVGLEALRRPTPDVPLVEADLRFVDGWGRDLLYSPSEAGYLLTSAGRDGALGTPDDLIVRGE